MPKKTSYSIQLTDGQIINGFSRWELLNLSVLGDYSKALVKLDKDQDWIPIHDWKQNGYDAMERQKHYYFHGESLAWWDKLMSLTFLYPKSWRLISFELKDNYFTLVFGNGKTIHFSETSCNAEINIDKQMRRKITIILENGEKHSFFESLMGYGDSDFDLMVKLLKAKESSMMRFSISLMNFNRSLRRIINAK